jgi:hypothetical protein
LKEQWKFSAKAFGIIKIIENLLSSKVSKAYEFRMKIVNGGFQLKYKIWLSKINELGIKFADYSWYC